MKKIKKLVAIQPVSILEESKEKLKEFCEEIIFFDSQPESAEEIVERIGDADAVFVSYTHAIGEEILAKCPNLVYIGMCFFDSQPESAEEIVERIGDADAVFVSYTHAIGEEILAKCPNLVYIGMCCSLYSEESSNVDIAYAREHGITVTGIRDYGDEGVAEYVLEELLAKCPNLEYIGICGSLYSEQSSNVDIAYAREHGLTVTGIRDYGDEGVAEYVLMNLIGRLHGTDGHPPLVGESSEISGARIGLLGLGASAQAVARALGAMGAQISYYSRTRKPELEEQEMSFVVA